MSLQLQLQSLQRELDRTAPSTPPRWAASVAMATRQTMRLAKLTDALVDVSQLKTGRFDLQLEELDLTIVVREIVHDWSREALRVGCELRFHGETPTVGFWDRLRIEQALVNLISNAMKYAPGQPVDVSVTTKGRDVFIAVQDQGMGVAGPDQERIFQLFERVVTSEHYGGLGLGLFVARKIAEAAGGTIAVASELGKGTTFCICLPVRTHAADRAQATSATAPENPAARIS